MKKLVIAVALIVASAAPFWPKASRTPIAPTAKPQSLEGEPHEEAHHRHRARRRLSRASHGRRLPERVHDPLVRYSKAGPRA